MKTFKHIDGSLVTRTNHRDAALFELCSTNGKLDPWRLALLLS